MVGGLKDLSLACHSKACNTALGTAGGLRAIADAGFAAVVAWSGAAGEQVDAVRVARDLGLDVAALACPKFKIADDGCVRALDVYAGWAVAWQVPSIAVMFSDLVSEPVPARYLGRLLAWLGQAPVRVIVENASGRADRFADPRVLAGLLADARHCQLALDLGHLAASGQSRACLASVAASGHGPSWLDRLAWIELHDNNGRDDLHLPLGQGTGDGVALNVLRELPARPAHLVVETDCRSGRDQLAWTRAMRADVAQAGRLAGEAGQPATLPGRQSSKSGVTA